MRSEPAISAACTSVSGVAGGGMIGPPTFVVTHIVQAGPFTPALPPLPKPPLPALPPTPPRPPLPVRNKPPLTVTRAAQTNRPKLEPPPPPPPPPAAAAPPQPGKPGVPHDCEPVGLTPVHVVVSHDSKHARQVGIPIVPLCPGWPGWPGDPSPGT